MKDRRLHLKIKIKTLAAEAAIIRAEARKVHGMDKWILNDHRTTVVRSHTRKNLLAYGLMRGVPYSKMEQRCDTPPPLNKVVEIAQRFGFTDADHITAWVEEAKAHLTK